MSVRNLCIQFSLASLFTLSTLLLIHSISKIELLSFGAPASCLPTDCFCEFIGTQIPKQRSNALSSLAFVFVSVWIILDSVFSQIIKTTERKIDSISVVYAVSVFLIGIGSFLYHATLTFVGQFFDVAGMNALANLILLMHLKFAFKFPRKQFAFTYLTLNVLTSYIIWYYPGLRRVSFAFLLLIALLLIPFFKQSKKFIDLRYLFLTIFIQACAYISWIIDIRKVYCVDTSWFQGHAVWHIISAVVCFLLYHFYKRNDFAKS